MNHNVVIIHWRRRQSERGSLIFFKEDKLKGELSKDDLYWLVRNGFDNKINQCP